jgi:ribosome-associated protein
VNKIKLIKLKGKAKSEEIAISGNEIKLDAFLKFANAVESGGMAKQLIQDGEVRLNGEVCTVRGKQLHSGDRVSLGGKTFVVKAEETCSSEN